MNKTLTIGAVIAIVGAVGAVATLTSISLVQQANAEPREDHGRCFENNGTSGCAGNVGEKIETHGGCKEANQGPFADRQLFSC